MLAEAGLARYSAQTSGVRETEIVKVDLDAMRHGDEHADLVLRAHDYLIIHKIPGWDSIWTVTLEGEVMFLGADRVRRNESLADVIHRAGGLTSVAFPEGAGGLSALAAQYGGLAFSPGVVRFAMDRNFVIG